MTARVSASGGPISDEPRELMTPLVAAGVDVHGFPIACCDEHPECSHVYYCVQVYDACNAELSRLRALLSKQEAAHQELLAVAEEEVARKTTSDPVKSGAEYWAAQIIGRYQEAIPGVSRRIRLARAVLVSRAALEAKDA